MPRKTYDRRCPDCGSQSIKINESRFMAIDKTDNNDPRRQFAHCLPLRDYTRRRRVCNKCGHRFTTVEISQEDIDAVALEVKSLRQQVKQHETAMRLVLKSMPS
jgi:hypothetical protein